MNLRSTKKRIGILCLLLLLGTTVYAQKITVHGTVKDQSSKEALIGAAVIEKGTQNGVITNLDGAFSIDVPPQAVLEISSINYTKTEVPVQNRTEIAVTLAEDSRLLSEVVVVGYGVQKKGLVTGAISSIKNDIIEQMVPTRVDNVLRGMVSGVSITQGSGQPGDGSRVRIRGIGTINNSDPLYIVNGMPIDNSGIDFLNPNDIESIEILKDAASAAIYGSRGANGVIIVTTKAGKEGKTDINYTMSYGWQNPWKKRSLLNATEYATLMNEQELNSGGSIIYTDPESFGNGTDWQEELFNFNAPIVNHQVSASGGTKKGNYYISFAYFDQEGIVGGDFGRSNYERYSINSNNNYTLIDESENRKILSKLKIGSNLSYSRITSTGISTNSEFGSPLGSALGMPPLIEVYAKDPEKTLQQYPNAVRSAEGRVYTVAAFNELTNPLAQLSLPGEVNTTDKFIANFSAELDLYEDLKFRTTYGVDLAFWGANSYQIPYYLSATNSSNLSKVASSLNRGFTWQLENVLTYTKSISSHNFSFLLGQSAKESRTRELRGESLNLRDLNPDRANIDFTDKASWERYASGALRPRHTLASYFARFGYNYNERYMLEATIRRDGSSNFGPNNKWAVFPSLSAGWTMSNEEFMKELSSLSMLKLRASWGRNGNESIDPFLYTTMMQGNNDYIWGKEGAMVLAPGSKPNGYPNKNLKWEESEQLNIGFDSRFFNNALTFTFDWYKKTTIDMLMRMSLPQYIGDTPPMGNVGDMKNSGVEFDLSYKFKLGNVNLSIGGNLSYLKNELIKLGNINGWENKDNIGSIGTVTRAQNGLPFPFFYGYKTQGLFQTEADVSGYVNSNDELLQAKAKPGDVRFVDTNNDGTINEEDRVMLGKGMPDWMYGTNLTANWQGFDFSLVLQGVAGVEVFDGSRRVDLPRINLPSYMLERWTGPNSSNTIPRLTLNDDNTNWQSSDLFVKNGSYLRLRNIQLGYTLPKELSGKIYIKNWRFFVAAENLFTITSYDGFDPEISSNGTSLGVDRGVYPQSRTILVGTNITF